MLGRINGANLPDKRPVRPGASGVRGQVPALFLAKLRAGGGVIEATEEERQALRGKG